MSGASREQVALASRYGETIGASDGTPALAKIVRIFGLCRPSCIKSVRANGR
jgi:hypothetical protein